MTAARETISATVPKGTRSALDDVARALYGDAKRKRGEVIRAALQAAHPSLVLGQLDREPQRPRTSRRKDGRLYGARCAVLLPALGDGACPRELGARYALWDVGELLTSHEPRAGFRPRKGYPAALQPRDYQRDKTEQDKVQKLARCLHPEKVVNNGPDALGGPPVLLPSGAVAGGNGRGMGLELLHAEGGEGWERYRSTLAREAHLYGFSASEVEPSHVLVRVLDDEPASPKGLAQLGHDLNANIGNTQDALALAVAESHRISDELAEQLGALDPDEPWSEQIDKSPSLRRAIQQVIPATYRASLFDGRGELTEAGETWLSWALLGRLLPDVRALDSLGPALRRSLRGASPLILAAGTAGKVWDVRDDFKRAVRLVSAARAQRLLDLERLGSEGLTAWAASQGAEGATVEDDPTTGASVRAALIAQILLQRGGPRQQRGGWATYAERAKASRQPTLFGPATEPDEAATVAALSSAFGVAVPRVSWAGNARPPVVPDDPYPLGPPSVRALVSNHSNYRLHRPYLVELGQRWTRAGRDEVGALLGSSWERTGEGWKHREGFNTPEGAEAELQRVERGPLLGVRFGAWTPHLQLIDGLVAVPSEDLSATELRDVVAGLEREGFERNDKDGGFWSFPKDKKGGRDLKKLGAVLKSLPMVLDLEGATKAELKTIGR